MRALYQRASLAPMISLRPSLCVMAFAAQAFAASPLSPTPAWPLKDKTLVAWVSPAHVNQRGGSVLTIEKPGAIFDAIVFGELAASTWMPGSDGFRRTKQQQADFPKENAANPPLVQI